MSTDYRTEKNISFKDVFDGRLEDHGILERHSDKTTDGKRCLTDGRNYLWLEASKDGLLGSISRYGANAPDKILQAIAETFETDIFSEHQAKFWGFDTQEEWHAYQKTISEEYRQQWYQDLCKYLRGEPNDVKPGTVGEIQANIARELVDQSPELMLPTNQDALLAKIDKIYDERHAVKVQLTEEDIASAKMIRTHEDDLPQA